MKPVSFRTRCCATVLGVIWTMVGSLGVSFAEVGDVVFSVITDKKTYHAKEPIQVEAVALNPSDESLSVRVGCPPCYRSLLVQDVETESYVYQTELEVPMHIVQVLTPHSQQTYSIGEVPADTLEAGKKYTVVLNFSLDLEHDPSGEINRVYTNPSTIIKVD